MTLRIAVTAEQLAAMGDIGRCELIDEEIIKMAPAGARHGEVTMRLSWHVMGHVKSQALGRVYGADTGFTISRNPDTVRTPDIAFVSKARAPVHTLRGYFSGHPDLAIEVVSFNDRKVDVVEKATAWIEAGVLSVWWSIPKLARSISIVLINPLFTSKMTICCATSRLCQALH
jgi:Uma2 family endonuclease